MGHRWHYRRDEQIALSRGQVSNGRSQEHATRLHGDFRVSRDGQGGLDAETEKLADGDPRSRAGGSPRGDPVFPRKCLRQQAEGGERAPSEAPREMASRRSWPSAKEQKGVMAVKAKEPWNQVVN